MNIKYDNNEIMVKRYNYCDIGDSSDLVVVLDIESRNNCLIGEYTVEVNAIGRIQKNHNISFIISNQLK